MDEIKMPKEWVLLEKYLFCYLNRKLESHVKYRNILYIARIAIFIDHHIPKMDY